MSLPADFDLKERVRSAVDIIDVIGATLELQPQGRNFVARCPWHNDRRPSMTINQERQSWKCWPCDIGGDVFSFVMRRDGVDFPTALRFLAEQAGIPIEQYQRGKKTTPGSPDDKDTLQAAMRLVCDRYFEILESGKSDDAKIARDYLAQRGIDDEHRKLFRIGFAPDSWSFAVELLDKHNFSGEVAHAASLALKKRSGGGYVDMFRGRLMFPIHDLHDRPISLGGRVIPEIAKRHGDNAGGKYINGSETKLFRKSHQLYGLQLAREAIRRDGEALVMEGYTDVVAARQAGVHPVVAVLGTALGQEHVKILKRFAKRVVLVLDGDDAGQRRADEVLELFVHADVDLRVLTLPQGSDPADYLGEHGRESFEQLVRQSPDALDHKLARLTAGIDVTRDTHAVTTAVDTMLGIIAKAPTSDGLRTDQLILRMSRTFDFKVDRLERRLDHLRSEHKRREQVRSSRPAGRPPNASIPRPSDPNDAFNESAELAGESASQGHVAFAGHSSTGESSSDYRLPPQLSPLTGIDRELFETLIENSELAAVAVEAIDPDWLEVNTAKMLLSAYQDLDLAGRSLDVASLMLIIENESLKNIVVTLEERVRQRTDKMTQTPDERFTAIMSRYREREFSAEKSRLIQQLESAALPEDEEDALLKNMFDQEKTRHKIKNP